MTRNPALRYGFTLIELMAVVVILAVLAGVALPKFFDYATTAKSASCKGALGGLRSGVANFYANSVVNGGTGAWPTLAELTTLGTVMQGPIPENPYNASNTFTTGTWVNATAAPRTVTGNDGWAYWPGSAAVSPAQVWADSNTAALEKDF